LHKYRTHNCSELRPSHENTTVKLSGWVHRKRDHGNLLFVDLRDHYGITQCVIETTNANFKILERIKPDSVISITGKVLKRTLETINKDLPTGKIEVEFKELEILSEAEELPMPVFGEQDYPEDIRLKYRFLDLRRQTMHKNIILRSKVISFIRKKMTEMGFNEFQTPILTASSPEGARDFLVPSRLNPGKFYALPQAPQQFKQMIMVAGFDKYFQIAPCFRDEDPRADRHACEFYQIDCEMSFVEQADIFLVVENYFNYIIPEISNKKIMNNKFYSMSFDESIEKYGTDKPDLRYDMKLIDVADIFVKSTNEIFSSIASDITKNRVKAIKVVNWDNHFSKTQMKNFEKYVRQFWAQGLWYFQMKEDWLKGPLNKFFSENDLQEIVDRTELKTWDVVFFWAADKETVCNYMGKFRIHLSELLNLANKNELAFCWITDFPMFEINEITGKIDFGHNPFSMPKGWIKSFEEQDLLKVNSVQYDLSCNWFEVLSGSIRNHDIKALVKAFEKVGRTEAEVKEKFWAMYEAFQYWVPPHGWFAIWMDRIMMILKDEENIREVYAFPKSWKAQDLMMNAPAKIEDNQLEELSIEVVDNKD